MKWVWSLLFLFLIILSGLMGLTAGVNLNPSSTVRFVPAWGSLGDWVSGIGALCAVISSLWLAQRSERLQALKEEENIEIEQSASDFFASVRVISLGHYPAIIKNVFLVRPDGSAFSLTAVRADGSNERELLQYPKKLGFREDVHLGWGLDNARGWLYRIQHLEVANLSDLRIEVWTTVRQHQAPLSEEMIKFLQGAARSVEMTLPPP